MLLDTTIISRRPPHNHLFVIVSIAISRAQCAFYFKNLFFLFLGAAISYRTPTQHDFSLIIFILNVFIIITVHCAGNLVNTYFDYVKGIDTRKSDDRTLVDHLLTMEEVSNSHVFYSRLYL
jgi:1,4-dihydroxy-2-naphthoate octaprenyltransferase